MTHALVSALAALAIIGACAPHDQPDPAPSPIENTRWIMANTDADGPTIEFVENRAVGYAGCNRWFAEAQADGLALSFGPVGATRRMCSPEAMSVEAGFIEALDRTEAVRLEGDTLVLLDARGQELARFTRR